VNLKRTCAYAGAYACARELHLSVVVRMLAFVRASAYTKEYLAH